MPTNLVHTIYGRRLGITSDGELVFDGNVIADGGGVSGGGTSFTPQGGQASRSVGGKVAETFTIDDVNPNIVKDGTQDNTEDIQEFFDTISSENIKDARLVGDFGITAPLTLSGDPVTEIGDTQDTYWDAKFTDISTLGITSDAMLTIEDWRYANFSGNIRFQGKGLTSMASKLTLKALKLRNVGRSYFDYIKINSMAVGGIDINDQVDGGNNSHCAIKNCSIWDCGCPNVGSIISTATVSARADSGSSGSISQRSALTVDVTPPTDARDGCMVVVDGQIHALISVSGSVLTVYPWPKLSFTTGTIQYIYGYGIKLRGNDTNVIGVGGADLLRCGVGIFSGSLYSGVFQRAMMQSCGVGISWGVPVTSTSESPTFINPYFETPSAFHMVRQTTADVGGIIISPYALDFAKVFSLTPRLTSGDVLSYTQEHLQGMTLIDKEGMERAGPQHSIENTTTTTVTMKLGDLPMPYNGIINTTTPNITLKAGSDDRRRLFRNNDAFLYIVGSHADGGATGTHTFAGEAGFTVHGGATKTFTGITKPRLWHAYIDPADPTARNWLIDFTEYTRAT